MRRMRRVRRAKRVRRGRATRCCSRCASTPPSKPGRRGCARRAAACVRTCSVWPRAAARRSSRTSWTCCRTCTKPSCALRATVMRVMRSSWRWNCARCGNGRCCRWPTCARSSCASTARPVTTHCSVMRSSCWPSPACWPAWPRRGWRISSAPARWHSTIGAAAWSWRAGRRCATTPAASGPNCSTPPPRPWRWPNAAVMPRHAPAPIACRACWCATSGSNTRAARR